MTLETPGGGHPGHGQGPAGASLSDLLTAVKNVAVNIANLGQLLTSLYGQTTDGARALTAPTLIKLGPGRVGTVVVTGATAGNQGYLVDANSTAATGPVIYVIPGVNGVYPVNMPFSLGLVFNPGPQAMAATVSYA